MLARSGREQTRPYPHRGKPPGGGYVALRGGGCVGDKLSSCRSPLRIGQKYS